MAGKLQNQDHKSEAELIALGATKTSLLNTDKIYSPKNADVLETVIRKNNYLAIVDPTVDNDIDENYEVGSKWVNTVSGKIFTCVDNADGAAVWSEGGSGGGGSLDIFYSEDFEGSVDASSFTKGNNSTFLGGGVFDGDLEDEETSPLSKTKSLKYTMGSSSTGDYWASPVIDIDEKQTNNETGWHLYFTSNITDGDIKFVVYDVTNSKILSSTLDIFKTRSGATRFSLKAYIPDGVTQIRWGCHVVTGNSGKVLLIDDVEGTMNPFIYKDLINTQTLWLDTRAGDGSATSRVPYYTNIREESGGGLYTFVNNSTDGFILTAIKDIPFFSISANFKTTTAGQAGWISRDGNPASASQTDDKIAAYSNNNSSNTTLTHTYNGKLNAGETIFIQYTGTASSNNNWNISVSAVAETASVISSSIGASQYITHDGAFNSLINNAGEIEFNTSNLSYIGDDILTIEDDSGNTRTKFINNNGYKVIVNVDLSGVTFNNNQNPVTFYINGSEISRGSAVNSGTYNKSHSATLILETGDYLTVGTTGTTVSTSDALFLNLTAQADKATPIIAPLTRTCYIKDVKSSGTNGGTFTAGAWQTRDFNDLSGDTSFITLDSNQITIYPGKYLIRGSAPAHQTSRHKAKLRNITDSTDDIIGSTEYINPTYSIQTPSFICGMLELTEKKVFELQHKTETTSTTFGFGVASGFTVDEIYAQLAITKLL